MNVAYIDNQNLYMATSRHADDPWDVDMGRLRVFLRERYGVGRVYLFMGAYDPSLKTRYARFAKLGYEIVHRPHHGFQQTDKKHNVDTDVVFFMMRDFHELEGSKIVLVSGDDDYKHTVDYLADKGRLRSVVFPSHRNASSLYKKMLSAYKVFLDDPDIKRKVERRKEDGGSA